MTMESERCADFGLRAEADAGLCFWKRTRLWFHEQSPDSAPVSPTWSPCVRKYVKDNNFTHRKWKTSLIEWV